MILRVFSKCATHISFIRLANFVTLKLMQSKVLSPKGVRQEINKPYLFGDQ